MSQKDAEPAAMSPQLETLEHVGAAVKGQKKLLLILMAVSAFSLLSAVLAIVMSIGSSAPEVAASTTLPQDTLARQLNTKMENLASHVDEVLALTQLTRSELAELSSQVAAIDVNDERNVIIRMQRLLIKQEQDFQVFLSAVEGGMYNFHMMVPHSRGWWEEFKAEFVAMNEKSKARENYASTLRDN